MKFLDGGRPDKISDFSFAFVWQQIAPVLTSMLKAGRPNDLGVLVDFLFRDILALLMSPLLSSSEFAMNPNLASVYPKYTRSSSMSICSHTLLG
jgi:hypothetical protein